ncbi:TetR/AcrR family transcriptional regulator [Amycolatopsis taiwanensis]|uniref:TetR family transcriptional regulator n=1 Tax=Amycolatopsis taiwanensis TaxID=342230 RepID=A0A9W6QV05_9PSEU|nr:TetR/AcrR family transcriptional regulator [Amycolatopsis taiwanensis]GLY63480.1 TetR family transcriptional regulator [Amycolatopsis taiwanensis]
MSGTASAQSGTRNRTRRAILSAACSVLARNWSATLAEIADAAQVGRTTLHRYFPDRETLIKAAVDDSLEAIESSTAEAAIETGPPLAAMRRLVAAMVAVGDRLMFVFGDPRVLETYGVAKTDAPLEDAVVSLIRRGQDEKVFDPEVSPVWIRHTLWALVYTGLEEVESGRLPRHDITATVIRTLENGITMHRSDMA